MNNDPVVRLGITSDNISRQILQEPLTITLAYFTVVSGEK